MNTNEGNQSMPEDNLEQDNGREEYFEPIYPPKPKLTKPNERQLHIRTALMLGMFVLLFWFMVGRNMEMLLVLLGLIVLHEFGHWLTMRLTKYWDARLFFLPLPFAVNAEETKNASESQVAWSILGGPIPGLLLGCFIVYFNQDNEGILTLGWLAIAFNAFHLLPFHPLDGGRLLELFFPKQHEWLQMIFLTLFGVFIVLFSILFQQWVLLVLAFFMFTRIKNEWLVFNVKKALKEEGLDYHSTYSDMSDKQYWEIRKVLLRKMPMPDPNAGERFALSSFENIIVVRIRKVLVNPLHANISIIMKVLILLACLAILLAPFLLRLPFQFV